ncbi:MAG: glycosyltransferase family 2 protein [Nitrososphaerota archaeon]
MNPLASVIVLNHNGMAFLEKCFNSLKNQSYPNYEVIMVDNASTDNSIEYVKRNFPWIKLIQSNTNLGYAGGNNLGAKKARGKYLVFLNNDTYVDYYWLEELVNAVENHKDIALAQSLILDYEKKGIVQCAGLYLIKECGWTWVFCKDIPYETFLEKYDSRMIDIFAGLGASIIIPKEVFQKIGGFDDRFFIYSEETDLSWRIWLKGYRVVLAPKSRVYHKLGGSASKLKQEFNEFHRTKNVIRMLIKNYSTINLFVYLPFSFLMMFMRAVFYLFVKRTSIHFLVLIKAISWNLRNLGDTLTYRKFVQNKIRKVSDRKLKYVMKTLPLSEIFRRMK